MGLEKILKRQILVSCTCVGTLRIYFFIIFSMQVLQRNKYAPLEIIATPCCLVIGGWAEALTLSTGT